MRHHIESGHFNAAIKSYRRVRVIDKDCKIDLLRFVKEKADEASHEARSIVENTLADASVPVSALLDAIRDLGELDELNIVFHDEVGKKKKRGSAEEKRKKEILCNYSPAMACLLLQAKHFSSIVDHVIEHTESITTRIYNGDSSALQEDFFAPMETKSDQDIMISEFTSNTSDSRRKNKWRYDVLEARVKATVQAVNIARKWLNRLLRIRVAAIDVERSVCCKNWTEKDTY